MAEHTPGPWKIEPPLSNEIDQNTFITANGGMALVAEILQPLTDEEGDWRGTCDARLIAAAPDLLTACKLALAYMEYGSFPAAAYRAAWRNDMAVLRKAVARAVARAEGTDDA